MNQRIKLRSRLNEKQTRWRTMKTQYKAQGSLAKSTFSTQKSNAIFSNKNPEVSQKLVSRSLFSYNKMGNKYQKKSHEIQFNCRSIIAKQCQKPNKQQNKYFSATNKYELDEIIGKGTFGVVYSAHEISTNKKVAIKTVYQDKRYKNRQLSIIKLLQHPNIVKVFQCYSSFQDHKEYLNIVMEHFHEDLYSMNARKKIKPQLIQIYMYQIFKGLEYLANNNIAHRDLKPHNILINKITNKAVICDFGSAKKIKNGQQNLSYICARGYRAPQLIFGSINYDSQVDVWSAGCVFVELINNGPLFIANSNLQQLIQIMRVLGTPSQIQLKGMNPNFPQNQYAQMPKIKKQPWKKILLTDDLNLIDLISKIMVYSPSERLTPQQILKHHYFQTLRNEQNLQNTLIQYAKSENNQAVSNQKQYLIRKDQKRKHSSNESKRVENLVGEVNFKTLQNIHVPSNN